MGGGRGAGAGGRGHLALRRGEPARAPGAGYPAGYIYKVVEYRGARAALPPPLLPQLLLLLLQLLPLPLLPRPCFRLRLRLHTRLATFLPRLLLAVVTCRAAVLPRVPLKPGRTAGELVGWRPTRGAAGMMGGQAQGW